jgi:hypothetical protein
MKKAEAEDVSNPLPRHASCLAADRPGPLSWKGVRVPVPAGRA